MNSPSACEHLANKMKSQLASANLISVGVSLVTAVRLANMTAEEVEKS